MAEFAMHIMFSLFIRLHFSILNYYFHSDPFVFVLPSFKFSSRANAKKFGLKNFTLKALSNMFNQMQPLFC